MSIWRVSDEISILHNIKGFAVCLHVAGLCGNYISNLSSSLCSWIFKHKGAVIQQRARTDSEKKPSMSLCRGEKRQTCEPLYNHVLLFESLKSNSACLWKCRERLEIKACQKLITTPGFLWHWWSRKYKAFSSHGNFLLFCSPSKVKLFMKSVRVMANQVWSL